jgi:CRISPR-associated protein Cas1
MEFSRIVVAGKIKNQEKLLRYFNKHIKKTSPSRSEKIEEIAASLKNLVRQVKQVSGNSIDECRQTLMGLEGTAGRLYWEGVKTIISHRVEFLGREHRGAPDLVNSMLNYGYGILYSHVWGALMNAGLEPFAGFLHVDRPGKPSLVLDLVEEFRQPVVDRVVISHINLGETYKINEGLLEAETRKKLAQNILDRLESTETFNGKKYQIRSIIQMQARNLASFLREGKPYKSFSFKW